MGAILPPTGERLLADAIRRAQRQGGQQLLVLHLGGLPRPRLHHTRIARAMLQDATSRHGGQVFPIRNGDLALLTSITSGNGGPIDPANLPATFAALFKADRPDPEGLLSTWSVEHEQQEIAQYLQGLLNQEPAAPPDEEAPALPHAVEDVAALLATANIGDLTQRQTAVMIGPDPAAAFENPGGPKVMRPLFREVTFSVAVLESRFAGSGRASQDPYLFRHLAARLDPRMMELVLSGARDQDDPLPLHLNLTTQTILSDAFTAFAGVCMVQGQCPGIEIPLIEACQSPERFALARDRVHARGMTLVLEGIAPLALELVNPASFGTDLIKLDWEPSLLSATPLTLAAIARAGPERIILQRAQTEQAIAFGLAHGISRFQGRQIDAMLAGARLKSCSFAAQCTLRQCSERAAAVSDATRRFCANLPLLDRGMPAPACR